MGDTTDLDRTDRPWTAQPPPVPHRDHPSMHDLVVDDLRERKAFGYRKYKSTLTAHNGRDPLKDAYEECLDLCVYLRQAIEERGLAPTREDGSQS